LHFSFKFKEQPRLANAGFGHNRNDLPGTRMSARGRAPERLFLFDATNKL